MQAVPPIWHKRQLQVLLPLLAAVMMSACTAAVTSGDQTDLGDNGWQQPGFADARADAGADGPSILLGDADQEDADAGTTAPDSLPPMPTQAMLIGYNEGWFGMNYGTDLTTNFDLASIAGVFDGILAAGGHLVRVWLFEFLDGIELDPTMVPQTQGLDTTFLANLHQVIDLARAKGLWLYLTAFDGNTGSTVPEQKDYFYNLLNNKYGEGDAFNDKVLAPVLALLDLHQDGIYGFDMMNEIQAPRDRGFWSDPINGPRAWMQRTAAFIKSRSPWLRVTSSAGWSTSQYDIALGFFSGVGLDFYDLHVYADNGTFSGASGVCSRAAADGVPVILGEFGQKTEVIDDARQVAATAGFLNMAKSLCFTAAIAWRFEYANSCWDYVRADGSFRPAVSIMQTFGALP